MTGADRVFVLAITLLTAASAVCFAWAYALHTDLTGAVGRHPAVRHG